MPATSAQEPAIRVHGLTKSYSRLGVLRGADFEVARGSIFALLGLERGGQDHSGEDRVHAAQGRCRRGHRERPRSRRAGRGGAKVISLTGQFAAVDEILSGRENLVLVARLRHLDNPGTIADGLLERFGLADAAARKVSTYSGGMRRRLDIAMSLIGDPPVIFLDEPTTGLDPQGRLEVWQAVQRLAEQGTTVLLTTQYLDEAEQLADRIAILHEGRILVNGTLCEPSAGMESGCSLVAPLLSLALAGCSAGGDPSQQPGAKCWSVLPPMHAPPEHHRETSPRRSSSPS